MTLDFTQIHLLKTKQSTDMNSNQSPLQLT